MEINNKTQHFNRKDLVEKIGEDEEFIQMLLNTYFDGFNQYLKGIKESIIESDPKKLKLNSHSLKGSSYSACLEIMGNIAATLEKTELTETENIEKLIQDLETERETLKNLLNLI